MTITVVRVEISIVVNPILVAGVVGRINVDAFDAAGIADPEPAKRIKIIPLDDQVGPGFRSLT